LARKKRIVRNSGDNVIIYYDPFNNSGVEGQATLIRLIKKRKETDLWWCVFEDGHKCKRAIKKERENDPK